jgi:hypothetical protein
MDSRLAIILSMNEIYINVDALLVALTKITWQPRHPELDVLTEAWYWTL